MPKSLLLRLLIVGLFGLPLLTTQAVFADSSDWVQVKRFKEVLKEAEEGKLQSMYEVGRKYERGRGTQRSMQKAAQWYQKAADANHASSKARLGILYVEGNGVKRDLKKATKLLKEAAEQGIPSAQYQLATMYELGTGVEEDIKQAIRLYRQAAKGGYYQAQNKVKELSSLMDQGGDETPGTTRAKPATPAPPSRATRALATVAAILRGNWERSGRPAGYLPSSISQCRGQNQQIKCISTAQERSTGTEVITYNTQATLSEFKSKQFRISYVNNVLEVEQQESSRALGYEEEDSGSSSTKSRIKAGQQGKAHNLQCTLENTNNITCVKDRFRTLRFTSK